MRMIVRYPGYTSKAITFSIDDGNLRSDKIFIDILRPKGFKGTFNLCAVENLSPEEYREFYRGFEIANHCKRHPYAFDDAVEYAVASEPFDKEKADPAFIYKHPELEGFYYVSRPVGWRLITDADTYIACIKACRLELEAVFGEGSVRSFVWPFSEQNSSAVKEYLKQSGYYAVRRTGTVTDTTEFDIPADSFGWRCNAYHTSLLDVAELYEAYPDDGRLKMFSFGVHSVDFDRTGRWDDLRAFAEKYGDRPSDYWYATVGEIFDYKKAADMLIISDDRISNPTDIDIYLEIDGVRTVAAAHSDITF